MTSYVVVKLILLNTFLHAFCLQYRRRPMRMVKRLEEKVYEEQLRSPGFFFLGLTIVYSFFPWKKSFQNKASIACSLLAHFLKTWRLLPTINLVIKLQGLVILWFCDSLCYWKFFKLFNKKNMRTMSICEAKSLSSELFSTCWRRCIAEEVLNLRNWVTFPGIFSFSNFVTLLLEMSPKLTNFNVICFHTVLNENHTVFSHPIPLPYPEYPNC